MATRSEQLRKVLLGAVTIALAAGAYIPAQAQSQDPPLRQQIPTAPGPEGLEPDTIGGPDRIESTASPTAEPDQSVLGADKKPDKLPERIRKDSSLAWRMAKAEWLDKACAKNPKIVAAICSHPGPAKVLAQHRRLDKIADADPYTCRRLAQWRGASEKLVRSKWCERVFERDPEGMYDLIKRRPALGRLLARSTMFNEMVYHDPELATLLSEYVK